MMREEAEKKQKEEKELKELGLGEDDESVKLSTIGEDDKKSEPKMHDGP